MAQPMHDDPMAEPPGGWPEPPPDPAELAYDEWLEGLLDWAEGRSEGEPDRDLADLVLTADPAELPERHRGWTVTDDGSAEWAMGRYARAQAKVAELAEQAEVWKDEAHDRLARIRVWFDHRAERPRATMAFMEAHLARYALDLREADPKAKTLVLPSGAVTTTEVKPKAEVADEDRVVTWVCHQWADDPEVADLVAAPQPRKLYVQRLRDRTEVVEVIDHARLLLASAELVEWVRYELAEADHGELPNAAFVGAEHQRCPQGGDGWPTPAEATDLVARVEVLASHLEVHGPDGLPVPGTHVEPGTIRVKVVPA